jgi:TRAP transporter TAXI family solute receptor
MKSWWGVEEMIRARKITVLIAMTVLALGSLTASAAEQGTREEAFALVQRTIAVIKRDGIDGVVKAVNDKDARFRDRDLFVFIHDLRVPGKLIAHGANIKLTQENNIDYKDQNGKFFVREQVEIGKTKGSGWVDYRIANADKTGFADKTAYVERVGDYLVGVGFFKTEAPNENTIGIISGDLYSAPTYLQIAHDMASVLNDGSNLRIVSVVGAGGVQNIRDVRSLKGIDIGFTQSNILNSYLRVNKRHGNAADEDKIVYITRLFNEEVHLIARADITSISQLRGQKVNIGEAGSGTAFTMRDIFKNLGVEIKEVNIDQADGMEQMRTGEIAATALVAGKPVPSIKSIRREDGFHILPIPYASALQADYIPDELTPEDYPELVPEGKTVETLAVSAVLIAFKWPKDSDRYRRVKKFTEALFSKIDQFHKSPRHPKWRDVNLAGTLAGCERLDAAEELLAKNTNDSRPTLASFENFLESKGLATNLAPEERERLFQTFRKWEASRQ